MRRARSCGALAMIWAALACGSEEGAPSQGGSGGGAGAASSGGSAGAAGSVGTSGTGGASSAGSSSVGGSSAGSGTGGNAQAGASSGGSGGSGGGGGTVMDPGTEGDGIFEVGPDYPKDPDLTDRGAPKGKDFQFEMDSNDSQIFRGEDTTLLPANQHAFTRQIYVYVPARYVDGTEAPILVIHDGPGQLELVRRALDNLTIEQDSARRLPAFVAIAVQNGGSDSKGSERGLEYDTMSDRFARFIEGEVLPAVLANAAIKAEYPNLKFTSDPEGKAALGCSSGGAAALSMGWFRPDLFRRLITYSGTFVDQQDDDAPEEAAFPLGAWEYHSGTELIANAPQKPLRIFQHVSDMDNGWDAPESGHHNWVLANERTAAALAAKSYHYRFVKAANAGHCNGKVFDLTLAETLLWAWRGYPN